MSAQLHRDMGSVEAGLKALEKAVESGFRGTNKRLDHHETALSEIKDELSAIKTRESERKGAWKAIVALAGGIGGIVGVAAKYLTG